MKIRKARKEDLKDMAKIFVEEYRKKPYNEKWTRKVALRKIKEYYKKNSRIWVVELDKFVVPLTSNLELGSDVPIPKFPPLVIFTLS